MAAKRPANDSMGMTGYVSSTVTPHINYPGKSAEIGILGNNWKI
jgi:hypothetical protein